MNNPALGCSSEGHCLFLILSGLSDPLKLGEGGMLYPFLFHPVQWRKWSSERVSDLPEVAQQ